MGIEGTVALTEIHASEATRGLQILRAYESPLQQNPILRSNSKNNQKISQRVSEFIHKTNKSVRFLSIQRETLRRPVHQAERSCVLVFRRIDSVTGRDQIAEIFVNFAGVVPHSYETEARNAKQHAVKENDTVCLVLLVWPHFLVQSFHKRPQSILTKYTLKKCHNTKFSQRENQTSMKMLLLFCHIIDRIEDENNCFTQNYRDAESHCCI